MIPPRKLQKALRLLFKLRIETQVISLPLFVALIRKAKIYKDDKKISELIKELVERDWIVIWENHVFIRGECGELCPFGTNNY